MPWCLSLDCHLSLNVIVLMHGEKRLSFYLQAKGAIIKAVYFSHFLDFEIRELERMLHK